MKRIYSEFGQIYKEYKFGYCMHAEREEQEPLSDLYNAGFLPHSADLDRKNIYYMARSCRIPLKEFALSSENKRVLKKFEGLLTKKKIPVTDLLEDKDFFAFCNNYFDQRHGAGVFTEARLRHVITYFEDMSVWAYYMNDAVVAYVIENRADDMAHYWFSFYDVAFAAQSMGLWIMLDCILEAQKDGLEMYYLGTVYGEKALYKTNMRPFHYWTGTEWASDVDTLKKKMREEATTQK